jgi:hypothetical protein
VHPFAWDLYDISGSAIHRLIQLDTSAQGNRITDSKSLDQFIDRKRPARELVEICLSESERAIDTSKLDTRTCFRGANDHSQGTSSRLIGEWV